MVYEGTIDNEQIEMTKEEMDEFVKKSRRKRWYAMAYVGAIFLGILFLSTAYAFETGQKIYLDRIYELKYEMVMQEAQIEYLQTQLNEKSAKLKSCSQQLASRRPEPQSLASRIGEQARESYDVVASTVTGWFGG
jgi:hypothetical protein